MTYRKPSFYQLNCQVRLATMERGIDGTDIPTCLGILDIYGGKSNIGHNLVKVVGNKIEPIV